MTKWGIWFAAGSLVAVAWLSSATAAAYGTFSTDSTNQCSACHTGFVGGPGGPLHDEHTTLFTTCNGCHPAGAGTTPVSTYSSGDATFNLSCMGCHGRAEDVGQPFSEGYGARLRAEHNGEGVTLCANCHANELDNYTPVSGTSAVYCSIVTGALFAELCGEASGEGGEETGGDYGGYMGGDDGAPHDDGEHVVDGSDPAESDPAESDPAESDPAASDPAASDPADSSSDEPDPTTGGVVDDGAGNEGQYDSTGAEDPDAGVSRYPDLAQGTLSGGAPISEYFGCSVRPQRSGAAPIGWLIGFGLVVYGLRRRR